MKIFIALLLGCFASKFTFAVAATPVRVLYDRNGTQAYGAVNAQHASDPNRSPLIVTREYYITPSNRSVGTDKIPRQDLSFEVPEIQATFQNTPRTLKKGVIVLGKDRKPYVVEAVFPNGKVAMAELEINPVSRFRLEQNRNFAPIQRRNVSIVSTSDILAVEQTCFLQKYCKGQTLETINDIPICEAYNVRNNGAQSLNVPCGRFQNGAAINAVFSDGTLMLHLTLINPFPEATLRYQQETIPEAAQ